MIATPRAPSPSASAGPPFDLIAWLKPYVAAFGGGLLMWCWTTVKKVLDVRAEDWTREKLHPESSKRMLPIYGPNGEIISQVERASS